MMLIMTSCTKVIHLDISSNEDLTDASLFKLKSLPHLKYLEIAYNQNFTDTGLMSLNEDLKFLDLTYSKCSSTAILAILRKMLNLKELNVECLKQLDERFAESAIDIVKLRPNNISLEIHISDTSIVPRKVKNVCSLVYLDDENSSQTDNDMEGARITINTLNDDCLLHIFNFTRIRDRINLELVCQRWQKLCQLSWKNVRIFDISESQFKLKPRRRAFDYVLDITLCKQIFSRCSKYLTRINLSRARPFHDTNSIQLGHCCSNKRDYRNETEESQESVETELETLDDLKLALLKCHNIKKLCLCVCVIRLTNKDFVKLFENNKKLRFIVLSSYRLTRICLSHLPFEVLESIEFYQCQLIGKRSKCRTNTPKLHTLSVSAYTSDCDIVSCFMPHPSSLDLIRLNAVGISLKRQVIYDSCNLKNLTFLVLKDADLTDHYSTLIMDSCEKLVVLEIAENRFLTDVSLRKTKSLPGLKYLGISFNYKYTDAGLLTLSENLQILDLSCTDFSPDAILIILGRMLDLKKLNVTCLVQLDERFVESVVDIMKIRPNETPLQITTCGTSIEPEKIRNLCPVVKLEDNPFFQYYSEYL
ncbi:hypothetical protein QAD02_004493 [Eretmocerus hayati]|uniref:Uncharacterized protein n=1 Tax=Eretmocerus hayati TaxID=131215 RepID=A0ACC2NQS3_9HYME|nr:hypothetical protein QAD02_004493 [Eretmocerus hayati]